PTDERKRHPYYETTHYSKVKALGGIKLVESKSGLCEWLGEYLQNPTLHKRERTAVALQQAQFLDGKSGTRVAEKLLAYLFDTRC
ncbi:MAG: hypothetical protein Q8R36_02410, partial [bacterium]|nr:hypothetical protein [bacterium]